MSRSSSVPRHQTERFPPKTTEGEPFPHSCDRVPQKGRDIRRQAVLLRPDGGEYSRARVVDIAPGLDRYRPGSPLTPPAWSFRIDSWSDPTPPGA